MAGRKISNEDTLRKSLMEMDHRDLVELYLKLKFDKSIENEAVYKGLLLAISTMRWNMGEQSVINACEEMLCEDGRKHNEKLVQYFTKRGKEIEW